MPERFRRSRTRYENNESIYVGERGEGEREREKENLRERERVGRELSKWMVEYLLRSSSPHSFQPFTVAWTIPNSNTSGFYPTVEPDKFRFPLDLIKREEI